MINHPCPNFSINTIELTSIWHKSHTLPLDWYLIDVGPKVFAMKKLMHIGIHMCMYFLPAKAMFWEVMYVYEYEYIKII